MIVNAGPDAKRLSVYSKVANYSVPVVDVGGQEFVSLLEILEPLGSVTAKGDSKHWKLRYNGSEMEFSASKSRAKMKGHDFDLGAEFEWQDGQGLVPLKSLGGLLAQVLGGQVTLNPGSRRIFIGNVAIHFTAEIGSAVPPNLVMTFTAPVNPTIATEAGKLRMVFSREPIVQSGTATLTFNNHAISSATYQENNGAAEITVAGNAPLFANFSNDRKTITITAGPTTAQAPGANPSSPAGTTSVVSSGAQPTESATSKYFAVIDPSHGGTDSGATLSGRLVEKDVTLEIAQRLLRELEAKGITALLLRTNDATLSLDERANRTNTTHPAIYICLHVSQGKGIHLYSSLLPAEEQGRGRICELEDGSIHCPSGKPRGRDFGRGRTGNALRGENP